MVRFLCIAKGVRKGEVSVAMPDGHVFGRMEDYDQYVAHFGSDKGWPDSFVIVDVPDMTVEEGETLSRPAVHFEPGNDPLAPEAKLEIIDHIHAAVIDFEPLERFTDSRETLVSHRKIARDRLAVLAMTVQR